MQIFAAARGISAPSGLSPVTGLCGTGLANPPSACQAGSLPAFKWSFTGAPFALKGRFAHFTLDRSNVAQWRLSVERHRELNFEPKAGIALGSGPWFEQAYTLAGEVKLHS